MLSDSEVKSVMRQLGEVVVTECRNCGKPMLYWYRYMYMGPDIRPYRFDRVCVRCITPAELKAYWAENMNRCRK